MMISFQVRPAAASDSQSLTDLSRAFTVEDGREFSEANATAVASLCDGRPDAVALLAVTGEASTILGYAVLTLGYSIEHGGVDGFIDEIYVIPAMRNQGIGLALLDRAETEARLRSVKVLHLEAEKRNEKAQALYRSLGYYSQQRVLMSKPL